MYGRGSAEVGIDGMGKRRNRQRGGEYGLRNYEGSRFAGIEGIGFTSDDMRYVSQCIARIPCRQYSVAVAPGIDCCRSVDFQKLNGNGELKCDLMEAGEISNTVFRDDLESTVSIRADGKRELIAAIEVYSIALGALLATCGEDVSSASQGLLRKERRRSRSRGGMYRATATGNQKWKQDQENIFCVFHKTDVIKS